MEKKQTDHDELFNDILAFMIETGNLSMAAIQRKFSIGFARTARIFVQLEDMGIISYNEQGEKKLNKEAINNPSSKTTIKKPIMDINRFDILIPEVLKSVMEDKTVSISRIQRTFVIGYARAARIVEQMEENGFIESRTDCKPRKVLIDKEEYQKLFGKNE